VILKSCSKPVSTITGMASAKITISGCSGLHGYRSHGVIRGQASFL
jgi:hypothetical protein